MTPLRDVRPFRKFFGDAGVFRPPALILGVVIVSGWPNDLYVIVVDCPAASVIVCG
jgi:hypothetical protein